MGAQGFCSRGVCGLQVAPLAFDRERSLPREALEGLHGAHQLERGEPGDGEPVGAWCVRYTRYVRYAVGYVRIARGCACVRGAHAYLQYSMGSGVSCPAPLVRLQHAGGRCMRMHMLSMHMCGCATCRQHVHAHVHVACACNMCMCMFMCMNSP